MNTGMTYGNKSVNRTCEHLHGCCRNRCFSRQPNEPRFRSVLTIPNLVWLGILSSIHSTRCFADILSLTVRTLDFSANGLPAPVAKARKNARRRKRRSSKHSPQGNDPAMVTEDAFAQARNRMPARFWTALIGLLTDSHGTPVGLDATSASPHEVNLVEPLVLRSQVRLPRRTRLLYDKAADSAALRRRFGWLGIRLIAPFRKKRDGSRRRLSARDQTHYSTGWKVERTFAWLKQLRRLGMRWEYHAHLFEGFCQLGCLFIILKGF